MRIVYLGSSHFGVHCLEILKDSRHELAHIITQPAHKAGRGRKLKPTDAAAWAADNNIDCTEAADINSPEIMDLASSLNPDIYVVIAFGQKISQGFISTARYGAINVHASLLPKYRGAAPINRAIVEGETETGVTIITLAEKMDAGKMLGKSVIPIEPDDNAQTIHDKLALISAPLLLKTLDDIESGTAVYENQDESKVTFAKKLQKSDGNINWQQPAEAICRHIRGFWPWPGAFTNYVVAKTGRCYKLTIADAAVADDDPNVETRVPGRFDTNMNVICGEGTLKIKSVKPAGSRRMDFQAFLNGRETGPDDLFMDVGF
ncbi:Methionyl-tRNA formyltransferase [Limihaloglobus sulfuriphilus]|uniref:Methionyl-tRNA formyltransferase n=1 Tax=Limihaloglobus sulfuriphilus TaxID=1851148 RepID=A0A1Q2MIU4_9BACT|nr:methionyl-tRNA formyltransferase [Limihaloglobus sulfuriphilus]AQQ72600.1 Methionyl-tRNA formyltransferase [Limihaloglobus sulfuriphilus]